MSFAIKEIGKQVYVATEQFGKPGSLMLAREGGMAHYHPKQFEVESQAKTYLRDVVMRTRTGRKRRWEIVKFI